VALSSVTTAFGRNDTQHGDRSAMFVEGSHHKDRNTLYGRFEAVQVETSLLQTDAIGEGPIAGLKDPVFAFTAGAVRDIGSWRGFEGGVGADVSLYGVPDTLKPMYSARPVSFHVFFRLRPPAGSMGRMWNMRMSQPLGGHSMAMPLSDRLDQRSAPVASVY
jgi:hypothetical protein